MSTKIYIFFVKILCGLGRRKRGVVLLAYAYDTPCGEESCPLLRRALFVKSDKKYQKAPFETNGFKTSFPRSTAQLALDFTARQNRRAETSPKCSMAAAPNPLSRLPVQNAEVCTPTFQNGAAARVGAGTTPDFHQNAVFENET